MTREDLINKIASSQSKTAFAPFPKLRTVVGVGIPALGGQALGGLIQEGLGNDDTSTIEGKNNRTNNQLKARGVGALAGILAGLFLMRSGRMKSWKMYR